MKLPYNLFAGMLLILIAVTPQFISAQSLSGNVNTGEARIGLGYGNVDIYKGDKLVANVLTDLDGNFKIPLDTGTYRCEISYAGYEKVVKQVRVTADEKSDFVMEEDASKPKMVHAEKRSMGARDSAPSYAKSETLSGSTKALSTGSTTYTWSRKDSGSGKGATLSTEPGGEALYGVFAPDGDGLAYDMPGRSGALTAGEINDFSKWKLWPDALEKDLAQFRNGWKIAPSGRYTLELQTKSGIPIANALVKLKDKSTVLYTSRTDNTGKAELWATIDVSGTTLTGKWDMDVVYKGKTYTIEHVKPFETKVNHYVLDVSCEQSDVIDVAFVVDATGSMGDEMNFLTAELNDIVYQSKKISSTLNFRFANVFYKDHGDDYLTRSMDFSRVLSESVEFIGAQRAGGGGDGPEAVEVALDSAINRLSWSEDARTRILFLVLDAPPHHTDPIHSKLQELTRKAAEKGIRIVPLAASGIDKGTEYLMRCIAQGTNGSYVFLTSDSGIGGSHIAPTTDKFDVETLNQVMIRIVKTYTYMPDCQQQMPDLQLNYPDSIVAYPIQQDSSLFAQNDSLNQNRDSIPDNPVVTPNSLKITWNYWPNPTNGIVNVTCDTKINELYITDLSGKVLQVLDNLEAHNTVRIDLSEYATGIYLIRCPVGKSWLTGKIVLQRIS